MKTNKVQKPIFPTKERLDSKRAGVKERLEKIQSTIQDYEEHRKKDLTTETEKI